MAIYRLHDMTLSLNDLYIYDENGLHYIVFKNEQITHCVSEHIILILLKYHTVCCPVTYAIVFMENRSN